MELTNLRNNSLLYNLYKLKPYTIVFLIAQTLDFITTYIGLLLSRSEANPFVTMLGWENLLTFKLLVCFGIFLYFQFRSYTHKLKFFYWLIVVLASLAPVWNIGIILFDFA